MSPCSFCCDFDFVLLAAGRVTAALDDDDDDDVTRRAPSGLAPVFKKLLLSSPKPLSAAAVWVCGVPIPSGYTGPDTGHYGKRADRVTFFAMMTGDVVKHLPEQEVNIWIFDESSLRMQIGDH